jgi:Resolvase, N terminal domain
VLEFLHAGDILVVTRIDRFARSIGDLQDIVRTVRARRGPEGHGAADRYRYGGRRCFLDMLGVFAEFETNLRRERQLEGIAKAKAAGVYKGRPPSIEASRVRPQAFVQSWTSKTWGKLSIGDRAMPRSDRWTARHWGWGSQAGRRKDISDQNGPFSGPRKRTVSRGVVSRNWLRVRSGADCPFTSSSRRPSPYRIRWTK